MIFVVAAPRNYVDDGTRRLPELRLVSGRQHLKFSNRLLIELRGRTATDSVLVGLSIDHEVVISRSLAEYRRGVIGAMVSLAVDYRARHQLQEIEVVASVNGHVLDLLRRHRATRRSGGGINQNSLGGDINLFLYVADLQLHIKRDCAVNRQLDVLKRTVGKPFC